MTAGSGVTPTESAAPTVQRRKLIEVSLPLEAINAEAAREKSIRHGHPSTLHLWWARRPLAAARAVLFSQLVDDASSYEQDYRAEAAELGLRGEAADEYVENKVVTERERLHKLIRRLVKWENIGDEALYKAAHAEILRCTDGNPPPILDPFCGGGTIPLEAQRLGLEAHASDLNPVAVLITKALIEIPPKFAGLPPVFPGAAESRLGDWPRATGLAEDVRRYGAWMRDEAAQRIGHMYPKATLPDGSKATVIAWIWARTVTCPNPACRIKMPLVRSWWLGKKKGKEAYVVPSIVGGDVHFEVGHDPKRAPTKDDDGTMSGRRGATCIGCGTAVPTEYIRKEGLAGRLGSQLMATVAEGNRQRVYLQPTAEHEAAAIVPRPDGAPEGEIATNPRWFSPPAYGLIEFADLFTNRQLTALTTFSDLVGEARERVLADALAAGMTEGARLADGGDGAAAYADAVSTYLGLAVSKLTDRNSEIVNWYVSRESTSSTFARQAIPITWDFAEVQVLGENTGSFDNSYSWTCDTIEQLAVGGRGLALQADAASLHYTDRLVSTDPPYYDNIGYSDLSDYFYVWLRRSLRDVHPKLLSTMLVPKTEELVANPYRHNGKNGAEDFFEQGFRHVFANARDSASDDYPITVFYAFKQSETGDAGTASTGWQTLLEGMIDGGWSITGTWPMRSELGNRMLASGTNALASSIVLALRPRAVTADVTSRRGFLTALKAELPDKLRELQQGNIAPVDLAQAAIGPGMAVFSRYSRVAEADGSSMTVRTALALINQVLDEVLSEQEGDFDADTRFCVKWFTQFGWSTQKYGVAENLAGAVNISVSGLERGGIFRARGGEAKLLAPSELSVDWDPVTDVRTSVWEATVRIAKCLDEQGAPAAAELMARAGQRVSLDAVQELAYLLYNTCERAGRSKDALLFNGLGTSWTDLSQQARHRPVVTATQGAFDFGADDGEENTVGTSTTGGSA